MHWNTSDAKTNNPKNMTTTTDTALSIHQIYPASLVMAELNAAFGRDEKNQEAGGWCYFCDPEEGNVSESEARKLAYKGKPVFLHVDANFWYQSSEGGRSGSVGIEDNKDAWNILKNLSLEQEGTGDSDGYGIVIFRVNLNK